MTGCTVKITVGLIINELVQNPVLGAAFPRFNDISYMLMC